MLLCVCQHTMHIFTDKLHTCSYAQAVSDAVLYSFIQDSAVVRSVECAAVLFRSLRLESKTLRARDSTGNTCMCVCLALEIQSGGGSRSNSLLVRIWTGVRTLRRAGLDSEKEERRILTVMFFQKLLHHVYSENIIPPIIIHKGLYTGMWSKNLIHFNEYMSLCWHYTLFVFLLCF